MILKYHMGFRQRSSAYELISKTMQGIMNDAFFGNFLHLEYINYDFEALKNIYHAY